jgi:hypothetical protein
MKLTEWWGFDADEASVKLWNEFDRCRGDVRNMSVHPDADLSNGIQLSEILNNDAIRLSDITV